MRIAIGIHRLRPRGGQEDHCIRIVEALVARGHDVTLFSSDDAGGVAIRTIKLSQHAWQANHVRAKRFAADFLDRTRSGFDRTVAFQPIPGVNVLFIGNDLRNRKDTGLLTRLTPRHRTYSRLEADCFGPNSNVNIVGYSSAQVRAFTDRYPESRPRIAVLPPTLQPNQYRPELRASEARTAQRKALGIPDAGQIWLWVGLHPETKGLDRVLMALAENNDARLMIGGLQADHPKVRHIRRLSRDLGLLGRLTFLGYLTGERYLSALAAADVLAHPARKEASGATILEAVVNGLPVVATDICGFAEHVEMSGAGIVLPSPFSQTAFTEALRTACGQRNEEFSRRGIKYGTDPRLYSGIDVACDLIEATEWSTFSLNGLND